MREPPKENYAPEPLTAEERVREQERKSHWPLTIFYVLLTVGIVVAVAVSGEWSIGMVVLVVIMILLALPGW